MHPPVDAEGQSVEPDLEAFSQLLEEELGRDTAAIHWDLARETLQEAKSMPTLVGLAAEPEPNKSAPQESESATP